MPRTLSNVRGILPHCGSTNECMQQTLAYMFAHLTAENISPKGLCDVILAPRDEKTGALWRFTDGHIFCGEKQII